MKMLKQRVEFYLKKEVKEMDEFLKAASRS